MENFVITIPAEVNFTVESELAGYFYKWCQCRDFLWEIEELGGAEDFRPITNWIKMEMRRVVDQARLAVAQIQPLLVTHRSPEQ